MIYTFTFNPAIDYVIHIDKMTPGTVNRLSGEEYFFGGKGLNVSTVLASLGIKSKALGFIAGFTGDTIEAGMAKIGVETDFVRLESGFSRINVKIKSDLETDLNGQGPDIPENKLKELFSKLDSIKDGDTVVLAGSVPKSMPGDIYEKLLDCLARSGKTVRAVVDAEKELLVNVLKYKPYLIKPNNFELGSIFGVDINTPKEALYYAKKLQEMGAENVLVSMAEKGAVLLDETGKPHICPACKGKCQNSVGAGDSMVAGFLAGTEKGGYDYALRLGTAAGGATAFSMGLGEKEDILRLFEQIG